jgi:hypothetical protein
MENNKGRGGRGKSQIHRRPEREALQLCERSRSRIVAEPVIGMETRDVNLGPRTQIHAGAPAEKGVSI